MSADVVYLHPAPQGEVPPPPGVFPATYPVLPVGAVGHMNRLAAAGLSVVGLDVPVARGAVPGFSLDAWMTARPAPALVLLDLHWAEHAAGVLDAAARARAAWPGARIAAGGLTATRFADELLALSPALDAVILGDAELPVLDLARAAVAGQWPPDAANTLWRGKDGRPQRSTQPWSTPSELLDDTDAVDLSWLEHAALYRQMMHSRPPRVSGQRDLAGQWIPTGRGCAFNCQYCGGGRDAHRALSGLPGVRRRAPGAVARDVARLAGLGVQQTALTLDPDMMGRAWRDALFEALPPRPGLYVESFQLPSTALLDGLARRADPDHTEVALTPLSGDRAVRWRNGKRYDTDALLAALDALWARDLSAFVFFSLNLPGEDERALEHTVALAQTIVARAPADRVRVANICHTLDPAAPMAEDPDSHGVAGVGMRRLADWVAYGRSPRPWRFTEEERGFWTGGRDLSAMVGRWDAAARGSGAIIPVPRV